MGENVPTPAGDPDAQGMGLGGREVSRHVGAAGGNAEDGGRESFDFDGVARCRGGRGADDGEVLAVKGETGEGVGGDATVDSLLQDLIDESGILPVFARVRALGTKDDPFPA